MVYSRGMAALGPRKDAGMPIEREIKILGADFAALRRTLQALGADFQARCFEANELFDDRDGSLRRSGRLLRLRRDGRAPGKALFTYKEPIPGEEARGCKVRREVQTGVDDPDAVRAILTGLGLARSTAYEKFRETWRLDGCEVCLDWLPFGCFVELEGPANELDGLPLRLGLDGLEASDASYHDLHARSRELAGLPPRDGFVFEPIERERLARELDVSLARH